MMWIQINSNIINKIFILNFTKVSLGTRKREEILTWKYAFTHICVIMHIMCNSLNVQNVKIIPIFPL